MAYSSDVARMLAEQLAKFATLNRHQLHGQVANLDFWMAEVRHCLDVIDGYKSRFERLKAAQVDYVSQHGTVEYWLDDPHVSRKKAPPPKRIPGAELDEARRRLGDATYGFLIRCYKENFIDEHSLRMTCDSLALGLMWAI